MIPEGALGYDSRIDTYRHIQTVQHYVGLAVKDLTRRAEMHDRSKLESPERETFDEFTPRLSGSTYGSEQYKQFLVAMKPALDHHYAANDHHPEHYPSPVDDRASVLMAAAGVIGAIEEEWAADAAASLKSDAKSRLSQVRHMSLVSLTEMLCDWKAATMRHADGDLMRSIELNQARFGYSDELKAILINTARDLFGPAA